MCSKNRGPAHLQESAHALELAAAAASAAAERFKGHVARLPDAGQGFVVISDRNADCLLLLWRQWQSIVQGDICAGCRSRSEEVDHYLPVADRLNQVTASIKRARRHVFGWIETASIVQS